jgi:phosphoserine phosphatase RsbU/P
MGTDHAARVGVVMATLCLVLLVVLNVVVSQDISVDSLFSLAPLAACAVCSLRVTTGFGVAALALTGWSGWLHHVWGHPQQWVRFIDVLAVCVVAVVVAMVRIRRERRFARVARIAEAAQRAVLPVVPPWVEGLTVSARYLSASEDSVVGGDLYDCSLTEGYTRFIVGDVRGKGIAAVEQAARVIRAFRQAAATKQTLHQVVEDMDTYLEAFFDDEEFVTAAIIDVTTPDLLILVNCGHQPALMLRASGATEILDVPPGVPLGLGHDAQPRSFIWEPGDRLLLYTDGLTEARNAAGEFFPLLEHADLLRSGTIEDALDGLLEQVCRFVPGGELGDDLAAVLLERADPSLVEPESDPGARSLVGNHTAASRPLPKAP